MDSWTVCYWEENEESCTQLLRDEYNWKSIPSVNNIADLAKYKNKLVRFKCMIQDIRNPLYYSNHFEILDTRNQIKSTRSGKYRDVILCEEYEEIISESPVLKTCQVLRCINVPALNDWAKEECVHEFITSNHDGSNSHIPKRNTIDDETPDVAATSNCFHTKRFCSETHSFNENGNNENTSEIRNIDRTSCIVKLYDVESDQIKLNDVIEVVGFLVIKSDANIDDDDESEETADSVHTPHILAVLCVPYMFEFPKMNSNDEGLFLQQGVNIREELWLLLCQIFAGDTLAADYMICYLLSSVFLRNISVGHFPLNITNIPFAACNSKYTEMLYQFISTLVQKSYYFLMTKNSLNSSVMVPKKDYTTDKLSEGLLQLSSGTYLIIDETKLEPCEFRNAEVVVENVRALNQIISSQNVDYNFQFYSVTFNTDIPVLSLSTCKSLLQFPCTLPMETHKSCLNELDEIFARVQQKLSDDSLLKQLRTYLQTVKYLEYNIPDDIQQIVVNDYLELRQQNITSQDLHRLLVIARLNTLSNCRSTLTEGDWKRACYMEQARRSRLQR